MRDCPDGELRDLLPLYAADRVTDEERARVDAHLATCGACRAELDLVRAVARAYPGTPVDTRAIMARIPTRSAAALPFYRQRLWRLAASVTLMIGAGAMWSVLRNTPGATSLSGRGPGVPTVAPAPGGSTAVAPTTAPGDGGRAAVSARAIGLGVSLSDLTDAQLEQLLSTLESMDANVLADPEVMAKPIVPSGTDLDQGRGQ